MGNFEKEKFAEILIKISKTYSSLNKMGEKTEVTSAYLSKLINLKYNNPPTPKILKKIADNSNGVATYEELMLICGHLDEETYNLYTKYHVRKEEIQLIVHKLIALNLTSEEQNIVQEIAKQHNFLGYLDSDYVYINCCDNNLTNVTEESKRRIELGLKVYLDELAILYSKSRARNRTVCLYLNEELPDEVKEKLLKEKVQSTLKYIDQNNLGKVCSIPIYGRIPAGEPNWAEQCLDGYMPTSPDLIDINNVNDYFYLKAFGDSMNQKFNDGSHVLIHKQEILENGEIGVILINGYDATIKRFKQQDNLVILEPMSTNPEHQVQIYNTKEIEIKILGKAISYQSKL